MVTTLPPGPCLPPLNRHRARPASQLLPPSALHPSTHPPPAPAPCTLHLPRLPLLLLLLLQLPVLANIVVRLYDVSLCVPYFLHIGCVRARACASACVRACMRAHVRAWSRRAPLLLGGAVS